jgi:trk system potassium uptake protein TrkA
MNVFIAGAGAVGSFLCEKFSLSHEVTVIDRAPAVAQIVNDLYNVRVVCNHICSAKVLRDAEVHKCDVFIAMTSDDRSNILSCSIAKALGAKMTIARASDKTYADNSILNYQSHFGIDRFINPEALCALELAKEIRNPGRVAVERFSNGMIEAQQIAVGASSPLVGKMLREIKFNAQVRIGCIYRGDHYEFATPQTQLMVGDWLTIVGPSAAVNGERNRLAPDPYQSTQNVTISGGGETTIALIKLLLPGRFHLQIIENDREKCHKLTEQFPNITVIHGDATSVGLQREEEVGRADYFVACTDSDEDNIMSSLQASHLGTKNIMFVIGKGNYDRLLKDINYKLGIRKFVSPRVATHCELCPYVSGKKCWEISSFNDHSGQFVQLEVSAQSPCIGKSLQEINWPRGAVAVALSHNFETKVPSANDTIAAGDRMIVVLPSEKCPQLEALFL